MKHLFFTILGLFLIGCATVSYLPTDESITYPPTKSVKIFWEIPTDIPYIKMGVVSAQGSSDGGYTEEILFNKLKEKAMSIGADGIIMAVASQGQKLSGGTMVTPNFMGGTNATTTMYSSTIYKLSGMAIKFSGAGNIAPQSDIRPVKSESELSKKQLPQNDMEAAKSKLKNSFEKGLISVEQLKRANNELQSQTVSKVLKSFLEEKIDEKTFGELY